MKEMTFGNTKTPGSKPQVLPDYVEEELANYQEQIQK